jgi:hypothetical protein
MTGKLQYRSGGITALTIFFALGGLISFIAAMSLLVQSSLFDAIWRVNPRGREGLLRMGLWGVLLLFTASGFCAAAAIGLWRRARWGHTLATILIAINLFSDIGNAVVGGERRALIGVPIAVGLLVYIFSKAVRSQFKW